MTTDKDTKDAQFIRMNGLESGARRISNIRAESADQARKEAVERVAYAWREHGEDITLRIIRDAILSTVNESFTVAPVSTDAEKLAVAVKALEVIRDNTLNPAYTMTKLGLEETTDANHALSTKALKEIQG